MRVAAGLVAAVLARGAACGQTTPGVAEPWWKDAVIYEIYPRSFQDSNGDGVGDLNGITSRLDYLQGLGVNAIWLTPIYPSPQVDFGYDISDYTAIDPVYGTLADFDRLVAEAKRRGMRVIMDLVLNHTSDRHPWFVESASSRTNPKRDWYIWRDGKPGVDGKLSPPNNWVNRIEQSSWQLDAKTGQFYYHYYAVEQPDLNWRNPAVEKAMFDAARFWWRRGVAGFRLDAINTLFEDPGLRDAPPVPGTNEYGEPGLSMIYQRNLPETHGVLRDLRRVSDEYPERVLIGEIYTQSTAELAAWYGAAHDELQLPMDTNVGFLNKLDAGLFRRRLQEAEALGAGNEPLLVFDNHDRPRSWDRYGDGVHDQAIAKMLAAVLLASRSTSLIYQGEELGMETVTPTRREDVRDPRGLAGWPKEKGRDGERTPMQWDAGKNAGFSVAEKTWLPVEGDSAVKNVRRSAPIRGRC
jgi:alpha-glucosidase